MQFCCGFIFKKQICLLFSWKDSFDPEIPPVQSWIIKIYIKDLQINLFA